MSDKAACVRCKRTPDPSWLFHVAGRHVCVRCIEALVGEMEAERDRAINEAHALAARLAAAEQEITGARRERDRLREDVAKIAAAMTAEDGPTWQVQTWGRRLRAALAAKGLPTEGDSR